MERETKLITTPSGYKVKIKCWLTGKERQDINAIIFKDSELDMQSLSTDGIKFDGSKLIDIQNEQMNQFVLSIETPDKKVIEENIFDYLLNLKEEDFNFINISINEIVNKEKDDLKE